MNPRIPKLVDDIMDEARVLFAVARAEGMPKLSVLEMAEMLGELVSRMASDLHAENEFYRGPDGAPVDDKEKT